MRTTVDTSVDMGYIYIKDGFAPGESKKTIVVSLDSADPDKLDLVIDLDANGKILGIEVFGAKRLLPTEVYDKAKNI